ncbi:MAG: carboxypeptidase regulatory-like domain-containing protein [Cytophagia bacterium]|nr:MAG: carboxypeptidase regulatory-like domain-containing protein [Runella sp.]TAG17066.1 MAG: carboxypeptidase regulatory-like domain-containing protein [Cytophagales bacterium]TAG36210.1 MAG: carboxypeptidase regulatory-like domain-containing protein [Cytophagia bacterium]TAG47785.1 MAG: carboxypeptidase regulatory-like domain-containing protein [Runella slithyformis]TAG65202.1 MAG: carboxypeptidase regulatory-like domain-containing protein [Runella slithyformis]
MTNIHRTLMTLMLRNADWCGLVLILLIFSAFQTKKTTQGITGVVLWKAGNFMPAPDAPKRTNKATPVVREVYIYELTTETQTEKDEAGFYQKINTRFIKKVKTGLSGRFWVRLPVGNYSLFVKEEKGLYANSFDDANNIFPVQVQRKKWSKVSFTVDYQAVY